MRLQNSQEKQKQKDTDTAKEKSENVQETPQEIRVEVRQEREDLGNKDFPRQETKVEKEVREITEERDKILREMEIENQEVKPTDQKKFRQKMVTTYGGVKLDSQEML